MKNINKAQLLGNVGRDPEIRSLNSGEKVANFRLATNETWTQNGERKSKTEWHNIVVFNPNLVEIVEKYVKKGTPLIIEGAKIQYRTYTDKDQIERQVTELVLQRFGGDLILLPSGGNDTAGSEHFNGGGNQGFDPQDDGEDPFRDQFSD